MSFEMKEMLEMQNALQEKYKGISEEELKKAYTSKFEKNMNRW